MLDPEKVEFFQRNGYLVLDRPVLTAERLEDLRRGLERVISGESERQPELLRNLTGGSLDDENVVIQIVNIWQAEPAFRALIYDPEITRMTAQIAGDDTLRLWHDQMQYKPPRVGSPTDWHQDHPYWPIIEPADLVSCWVALDDATIENGCMRVVPGSHKWGAAPGGLRSDSAFHPVYEPAAVPEGESVNVVPCEVAAGACMFHHCLTWHGSYHNHSDTPRRAFAMHFMPGYTRYVPGGVHAVEHNVTVSPGEILQGPSFPIVLDKGIPLAPPTGT